MDPVQHDDVVSAGVDDLYVMETGSTLSAAESIVSAGLDDFVNVVVSIAPNEAFQEGEWVLYFSSTLACLIPARISGPGTYLTEDPGELPLYSCRVGSGQARDGVPLQALRSPIQPGESVEAYSPKLQAWVPGKPAWHSAQLCFFSGAAFKLRAWPSSHSLQKLLMKEGPATSHGGSG